MFTKNYKLKSSNSLKSSYRKVLAQKLKERYPVLSDEDLKQIIPLKASITCLKIVTPAEETACIYTVDNTPCVLEINEVFYPTVHSLWKCPHMLPCLSIESHLTSKLQEGIIHVRRSHLPSFGSKIIKFSKGDALTVNTFDNKAAILVGIAQYSSSDILIVQTGVCIKTLNIIGDVLCTNDKFIKTSRPELGPPDININKIKDENDRLTHEITQLSIAENIPNDNEDINTIDILEEEKHSSEDEADDMNNESTENHEDVFSELDDTIEASSYPEDIDGLLKYCLLCVLKSNGKNLDLPLKTNLLYANHMSSFCPSDKTLDIKKSSYKKLSKFLEAMQNENLIQVKEIEKGVDAIITVNFGHDLIKNHSVIHCSEPKEENDASYKAPTIREVFKITAAVAPLFTSKGLKKGQTVTTADIRASLVEYMHSNNLQNPQNKNIITVDPYLGTLTTTSNTTTTWEQLMQVTVGKMTHATEISYPNGKSKLITGKLKQITMQVANRSGNKKVTIVSNLEEYGLSLPALSKECQHGVAASCTITRTPGSKTDQLVVQGNQTYFIVKYLTEVYCMPKKFIEGADKILSKKKK